MLDSTEGLTRQQRRAAEVLLATPATVELMARGCTVAELAQATGWTTRYVKIGLSALEAANRAIRTRPNDAATGASLPSVVTLRALTPAA